MQLVSTTYLELTELPAGAALAAPMDHVTVAAERLAYDDYMALWRSIGDPLEWDGRRLMPRVEVEAVLRSPGTETYVARCRGEPCGLCEFNRTEAFGSEIVYFGVSPMFQGRRLGPYVLDASLRQHGATHAPHRIWLHTDTSDDPRALPLYQRMGFRVFARLDLPDTATEQDYRAAVSLMPTQACA